MPKALLLAAALACSLGGIAWFALAMEVHWQQALRTGAPIGARAATALRTLGGAALAASLLLCLRADHPSMAALVWVMSLAASALAVAMLLAWRAHWLAGWARLGARLSFAGRP